MSEFQQIRDGNPAICVPVLSEGSAEEYLFNHLLTYDNDKTGTQRGCGVVTGHRWTLAAPPRRLRRVA